MDRLSGVLMCVVTGVGFLIHLYSTEYMSNDEGYWRYFAYLNLFVAGDVAPGPRREPPGDVRGLGGRGLWPATCSSASGTRTRRRPTRAARPSSSTASATSASSSGSSPWSAVFGTVDFEQLAPGVLDRHAGRACSEPGSSGWTMGAVITMACCFLFLGATGKSAQLPLYVWLPDAMAGPTPVSALIHAATMVTAGVYMSRRLSFLYVCSPAAMAAVALVGALTALFAALIGLRPERHQEGAGLLHRLAARLHVHRRGRGRVLGGASSTW